MLIAVQSSKIVPIHHLWPNS